MDYGGFGIALQLIYATYLPRGAALVVLPMLFMELDLR